MQEVKAIVEGTATWKTSREVMEAYVIMQDMQNDVNRGSDNCFGGLLEIARAIYADYFSRKGDLNDPNVQFWKLASAKFKMQYEADIQFGVDVRGFSRQRIKKYSDAAKLIYDEMVEGTDFLERDEKGDYVVSGKTRMEQRKKKRKEAQAAAEAAANAAALRSFEGEPEVVVDNTTTSNAKPSTPAEGGMDALLQQAPAKLAEYLRSYVKGYVNMAMLEGTVTYKNVSETMEQKAERLVKADVEKYLNIFSQDMAQLQTIAKAAAAA